MKEQLRLLPMEKPWCLLAAILVKEKAHRMWTCIYQGIEIKNGENPECFPSVKEKHGTLAPLLAEMDGLCILRPIIEKTDMVVWIYTAPEWIEEDDLALQKTWGAK